MDALHRILHGGRADEAEASTEPLANLVAEALQEREADTMPVGQMSLSVRNAPRNKKPRVSFNTVTSATYVKDGVDPFNLEISQERVLSPLADSSLNSSLNRSNEAAPNNDDDTSEKIPSLQELCATPPGPRRESLSGELRNMIDAANVGSVLPSAPNRSTPARQRGLSESSGMALSMPGSVATSESPEEHTGEVSVTAEAPNISELLDQDELEESQQQKNAQAASRHSAPRSPALSVGEVTGEVQGIPHLLEQDEMDECHRDKRSFASRKLSSQSPASEWDLYDNWKKNERSDDEESIAARQFDQRRSGSVQEGRPCASPSRSDPIFSRRSSHASVRTQDSFDFEGINRDFDMRVGLIPPLPHESSAPSGGGGGGASSSSGPCRAPGHSLLASIGERRSPAKSRVPRVARSRSPAQDFAKWSSGRQAAPMEPSPQESDSGAPLPGRSTTLPATGHPIQQLTGGSTSEFGTRTRISWKEFIEKSQLHMPELPEMPSHIDCTGPMTEEFEFPSGKTLHEELQQQRAQLLYDFLQEMGAMVEEASNQYSVSKNMWDRATDIPSVAGELINVIHQDAAQSNAIFQYDQFIVNMKNLLEHCKAKSKVKWFAAKKEWLEQDLGIMRQHTQRLRDEVPRFAEIKQKCKNVSQDVRGSSRRMQHMGELHDIKQAYQDLGMEELRRTQADNHLMQRRLPEMQAALEADRKKNEELQRTVEEMRRKLQSEEASIMHARKAALHEQVRKNLVEKQFYARTCVLHEATDQSMCLKLRGGTKVWVEKQSATSSDSVKVCLEPSEPASLSDPTVKVCPKLVHGFLASTWYRALSEIELPDLDDALVKLLAQPEKYKEQATIPSQHLHRFLHFLDVEVLHMSEQLRSMYRIRKEVPEVADLSAELSVGSSGTQPRAKLNVIISVLRSHTIQADGTLMPNTAEAQAGKFNAVQCLVKLDADLLAPPKERWSLTTVEAKLGDVDPDRVAQSARSSAVHGRFSDMLAGAVRQLRQ